MGIQFSNPSNQIKKSLLFVGSGALKIIKKACKGDPIVKEFLDKAMEAYSSCATYMVNKLPLNNILLKNISAIDLDAILASSSAVLNALLHLPETVTHILPSEENELYISEARKILIDQNLPPSYSTANQTDVKVRADKWWSLVSNNYPTLSKSCVADYLSWAKSRK